MEPQEPVVVVVVDTNTDRQEDLDLRVVLVSV